ncbi:hypothetical protein [Hymenobacter lapidiphilus]|uniref:Uncharacterized protein n=1 Tax=Hymenobacter lapidiphilus TaxID=2608003 RepID=A0A7Y7PP01_9BACT|nr:hypothetical protein [Hymenobacter lapidiphilus]NVO31345.1 hypothetical protein [Hymenobacter lapidiphilus]
MRKMLFSALLLLSTAAAHAQVPATDSVQAVRNLFKQRRTGGAVFTALGIGAAGAIVRGASSGDSGGNAGGAIVSALALGGIPIGIGIGKLVRFSKTREDEIVAAYNASKPIPRDIRRRLKARHFAQ